MKHAVKIEQVDQDFNIIAANLSKQYPDTNAHHDAVIVKTELAALLGDTRTAAVRCARCGRTCIADRLCEHCQPSAGTHVRTKTRNCNANGTWRG